MLHEEKARQKIDKQLKEVGCAFTVALRCDYFNFFLFRTHDFERTSSVYT